MSQRKTSVNVLPDVDDSPQLTHTIYSTTQANNEDAHWVEDQADLDNQTAEQFRLRREAELRRRSQAVQRDLPRPTDMNHSVLRPLNSDPPLSDLQKAEELIKREMIVMMHHDCIGKKQGFKIDD